MKIKNQISCLHNVRKESWYYFMLLGVLLGDRLEESFGVIYGHDTPKITENQVKIPGKVPGEA